MLSKTGAPDSCLQHTRKDVLEVTTECRCTDTALFEVLYAVRITSSVHFCLRFTNCEGAKKVLTTKRMFVASFHKNMNTLFSVLRKHACLCSLCSSGLQLGLRGASTSARS